MSIVPSNKLDHCALGLIESERDWGEKSSLKKWKFGNSLVVQWLGLGTSTAGAQVQSLVVGTKIPQTAWYSQKETMKFLSLV